MQCGETGPPAEGLLEDRPGAPGGGSFSISTLHLTTKEEEGQKARTRHCQEGGPFPPAAQGHPCRSTCELLLPKDPFPPGEGLGRIPCLIPERHP